MTRRGIVWIVSILLILGCLSGCAGTGNTGSTTRPDVTEKQISVVATVFPVYDWARQIIGEDNPRVALTLLLDKGADLHSYQPTVEDIYKISTCDVFLYVGGASDKWVPDALAQASNPRLNAVNLLETLGSAVKEEESVEGMEPEHEDPKPVDEPEYDEHVWLSLRFAQILCRRIEAALEEADPDGADAYHQNCAAYTQKLQELDRRYAEALAAAPRKTLLFADRFPFRYLTDDYGLSYYAAFSGCSAETEASFETVNFLVDKLDELGLPCVMKLEGSDGRLAETIIENSRAGDAQILELNSLQSVTAQGVEEGASYLGIMEQNLAVLQQALGN